MGVVSRRAVAIPPYLSAVDLNLADVTEPLELTDTALFWHVHKAAGTAMETILSSCLGLVLTNEVGGMFGHDLDPSLLVFKLNDKAGQRFVNVDTTKPGGIQRAHNLGLAESGLADVVVTARFVTAVEGIFSPVYKGRMFTLLRHPVDRAISMFYYRQYATWEPSYEPCECFFLLTCRWV